MGLPERSELYQFPVLQRSEIMTVTPDVAQEWLLNNTSNRPLRKSHVAALALSITRGEWIISHQGIAFSTRGILLDGQHRLKAIIQAGIPVQMMVTTGVDENAYKVLDCGVKRTLSDLARLDKKTAEVCRLIGFILKLQKTHTIGVSVSSEFALTIAGAGIADAHQHLMSVCNTAVKYLSSAAIRTAAVISVLNGGSEDFVYGAYRNLCLYNTDDLPNSGKCLIKMFGTGRLSARDHSLKTLAYGLAVFDERATNRSRITITDEIIGNGCTLVRKVMSDRGVRI